MALAAVLAWLASRLLPSPQSFIAPYAAVFLMAETVYRSITNAVQQTVTLVLGLVLAYVAASVIPASLAALGVAVFVGMLLGRWHRLGSSGAWVGVTALLMITYGTAESGRYLLERVGESLLGAAVGVAVNMLILPPVHLRHSREAGIALAGEIRELLSSVAAELVDDWDRETARSWLWRARTVDHSVHRARDALGKGHESIRFNLRWRLAGSGSFGTTSKIESSVGTLAEVSSQLQRIAEALATSEPVDLQFRRRFAGALETLAQAISCYEESLEERVESLPGLLDEIHAKLRELAEWVYDERELTTEARQTEDALLLSVSRALRVLADDTPALR